ncbi:MAG TPA: metal-dependent hydrolase [Candidatus Angelobacter sp.]|nr:metal-dependent hydrolase [Candidatus Angelobacter sp.]
MDTITHGIAGALIGKALFRGEDLFGSRAGGTLTREKNGSEDPPLHLVRRGRILTWSLMLGAIFPDSDVIRDFFSHDKLLIVTWHRSITHSLIMLPLWALLLAAITRGFCSWRKWEAPSFANLTAIYCVGILSHILLDLVTSFGTMIWSPLEWSRPAWDLIFIIDFTLTGILLVPQFLAWAYSQPEKMRRRAIGLWLVFMPSPFLIARIAENAGAPISDRTVVGAMVVLALLILVPLARGWGGKIPYGTWNRAGFGAALIYVALTFFAHRAALARIEKFAEADHLHVQSIGALPLPPSLWHWDGLVRAERGVYELRMDLSDKAVNGADLLALEHRYFPDSPPNSYIDAARRLPEVQKVLWFARFPVTRFHKEGENAVVEFLDIRFRRQGSGRPPGFTYEVRFGPDGNVLSQGWVTR